MMRTNGWLFFAVALLLAGCGGAARQPVVILPEYIAIAPDAPFMSQRDFAPASPEWLADSGPLAVDMVRAALAAAKPDSFAAQIREICPGAEVTFPAGWHAFVGTGDFFVSPNGARFLVELLLPPGTCLPAGTQVWLQYNLTRDRPEYLYFVAR